ncbi:MAG: glycerol-3-phosphate 1-O-acyltransferase PlsY [Holosporales bacterium]|nr:glycerol-3-phosphate 1-O-acyltransferase PlsY [Holosporales bacterium]
MLAIVALAFLGYLFGTIQFGAIFARVFGLGDIRSIGSGNPGATNVLRTGHRLAAALTFAGDLLKGSIPVWIAAAFTDAPTWVVGIAPILGHVYPIWTKFKGGKGVATAAGAYLALSPIAFLVGVSTWLMVFALTRISSLSALISVCGVVPLYASVNLCLGRCSWGTWAFSMAIMVLVCVTHAGNIRRLLDGREMKISQKP